MRPGSEQVLSTSLSRAKNLCYVMYLTYNDSIYCSFTAFCLHDHSKFRYFQATILDLICSEEENYYYYYILYI